MKQLILSLFLISCISFISSGQEEYQPAPDKEPEIIVGKTNREAIQQGDFGHYFLDEYAAYEPCTGTLNKLENEIYDTHITIVMATWCSDSQQQVPRFYKILDRLDYKTSDIELICVDHDKKAGPTYISDLDIEYVPTFIFFRNGKEVGRIVESPEKSLEKDTYQILSE